MEESVFTKIINNELPSYKVYEDEKTLAFLNIFAVVEGHTLVIPKKQVEYLWDLEDEDYQAVMATCKKVALRLKEVLGVDRIGEKVIGVDVPHAHVHIIPFNDIETYNHANDDNAGAHHESLDALAKQLYFE